MSGRESIYSNIEMKAAMQAEQARYENKQSLSLEPRLAKEDLPKVIKNLSPQAERNTVYTGIGKQGA